MTTLTRLPKNFPIQTLPYIAPAKKTPKVLPYKVVISEMGVMVGLGSYKSLAAAAAKAAKASEEHGSAMVYDASLAMGSRMVRLFKRGVDFVAGPQA